MNERQAEIQRKKMLLAKIRADREAANQAAAAAPPPPPNSTPAQAPVDVPTPVLDDPRLEAPTPSAFVPVRTSLVESSATATQTKEFVMYTRGVQTDVIESSESESDNDSGIVEKAVSEEAELFEYKSGLAESIPKIETPLLTDSDKRKIVADPGFQYFVHQSARLVERMLISNENEGKNYYTGDHDSIENRDQKLFLERELFDKTWNEGRRVTDMHYSLTHPELIVVSYTNPDWKQSSDNAGVVQVWNLQYKNGTNAPEHTFLSPSPVLSVKFARNQQTFVIGACYNGQIYVWDMRTSKTSPTYKTFMSATAHTSPVRSLQVIGNHSVSTLASVDSVGRFCMWNLDDIHQPFRTLALSGANKPEFLCNEIQVEAMASVPNQMNSYIVGCLDGLVASIEFDEKEKVKIERIVEHRTCVTAVDVHPVPKSIHQRFDLISRLVLSSSLDYAIKLSDMNTGRELVVFEAHKDYVMDVKWHPTNPAIFASLDVNGWVYIWDISGYLHSPIYIFHLLGPANRLLWSQDGKRLLTGNGNGHVQLYSVDASIWKTESGVWQDLANTVERLAIRHGHESDYELLLKNCDVPLPFSDQSEEEMFQQ